MAEIQNLLDAVKEYSSSSSSSTSSFHQSLRSDSVNLGFHKLYSILSHALDHVGGGDDGKLRFQSWDPSQIRSIVSLLQALVLATRSLSVELAEPIVIATVQVSIDFSMICLEKTELGWDDTGLQNDLLQLLEMALTYKANKVYDVVLPSSSSLMDLLPENVDHGTNVPLVYHTRCNTKGCCAREERSADPLLLALASEYVEPYKKLDEMNLRLAGHNLDTTLSFSQHWAVVHVGCVHRLILLSKTIAEISNDLDEKTIIKHLTLSIRVLKLLGTLAKEIPFIEHHEDLMQAIALWTDALPNLFAHEVDRISAQNTVECSIESLGLLLLEEFVQLLQIIFGDTTLSRNVQTCLVASIFNKLDSRTGRYNDAVTSMKIPLACTPRTIVHLLKLLDDVKKQKYQAVDWKEFALRRRGSYSDTQIESLSCHVHGDNVCLLKHYTVDELYKIIFPSSMKWLDILVHLIFFFHSEGVRLKPKPDRSLSTGVKSGGGSELESTMGHEEEALFGDLFSESSRSVGSGDGSDQPLVVVDIASSYAHMSVRAASELLSFLKSSIFSSEKQYLICEDGCKQLSESHIDALLSIINCRGCYSDEMGDSIIYEHKKIGLVHEPCLQLMHNIITHRVLSDSLEEYLTKKILDVDGDNFVYNDRTLTLSAQILICRAASAVDELAPKIYAGYVEFVIKKAKYLLSNSLSIGEVIGALPSMLHIEILLLAFHLCSEIGKANLANFVFKSLRSVALPSAAFSSQQLSSWAIVVSRLVIVLRHMLFHPSECPPQLLLDLRTKFRETQCGLQSSSSTHNIYSSWVSSVVGSVGALTKKDLITEIMQAQLIDFVSSSASCRSECTDIQCLSLSWDDVSASFLMIMKPWSGKMAETVEDLILERYMFALCWDILTVNSHPQLQHWIDSHSLDVLSMEQCFHVGHFLVHSGNLEKHINIPDKMIGLISCLHDSYVTLGVRDVGWDFIRNSMQLSLVLSLLDTDIQQFSIKHEESGIGYNFTEQKAWDMKYIRMARSITSYIIESGQASMILRMLSSLLQKCVKVYQINLCDSLSDSHAQADGFSPILLLMNIAHEKPYELIKNLGYDIRQMEFLYDILPKIEATINKKASGVVPKVVWESMLHGIPLCNHISSGAVLSCIILIRKIICIVERLLKTSDAEGDVFVETEVVCQILDSVMTIKSDKVFETIHENCKAICSSLSSSLDGLDYGVMFMLKQMKTVLMEISSKQVGDSSIHEWIVTNAIDTLDSLRKDSSQQITYKFYTCEGYCEELKGLHGSQNGDLMFLVDSLDDCSSETVNIKALNFFSDVIAGNSSADFKRMVQKKFLETDIPVLSKWLEKRLLGSSVETSDGTINIRGSGQSLRESTMKFITCLVSPLPELSTMEIQSHILEAAMGTFDSAFMLYDITAAKSYFHFVAQLSKAEASVELLVRRTVMLLDRLTSDEKLIHGLKFLLGFLGSLLTEYGSTTGVSEKSSFKAFFPSSVGTGPLMLRATTKNLDSLLFSANQGGGSASIECDAISVDEDEDDGTSDGEVASLDKDEEDDGISERALASKVCTFTSSGSNFMEQHWYFCYTCDLTVTKGCCSVCAKVCHRGHRVVYSRSSRFFCDCGAGGVRGSNCQCLKPRKFASSNSTMVQSGGNVQSPFSLAEDGRPLVDSDSDLDENMATDVDNPVKLSIPRELQNRLPLFLMELDVEGKVVELCSSVMPSIVSRREANLTPEKKITLGEDKTLSYAVDLLQLKKAYKSGSMDLKMKVEYSNAREVKSLIASGSLVKSLLSVSVRGRLAVGEGDRVAIFDVGQLIGQATVAPVTADKANVKALSKNLVRFEILQITFNPLVENYLAVAGYEDCQVLTVSPRGEVSDRLPIELALQGAYIRRIDWVPGSQVQLMVVANSFIKIYDLSQDNISPVHYFTLPDDMIVDASVVVSSQGRLFLIVLSEGGSLFRLELSLDGEVGVKQLKEILHVRNKVHARGSSLYFSAAYKLLFISYQDGTSLIGHLNPDATSLVEISNVYESEDGKLRPAGLHRWKELLGGSGLFYCFSSIKSASLAISIGGLELTAQHVRHTVGPSSPLVGITAYKPLSKDRIHCLALHDDGSLQIYSHVPVGVDGLSESTDKVKKLGTRILENDTYAGSNPEFPLDFFEKTFCITADVKLGGDAVRNGDSEGVKQNLASDDGFLESHSPAGFKITISNSNPDVVMVGFRVHAGNTSSNHIPSNIKIFNRLIKLDEGMRSWYDIPFTVGESLLADEEFTVFVGPTFNGSALPRVDSLEVYGRAKDEFGWKEKMDAILDMESRGPGCSPWVAGAGKKTLSSQSAPIQDQVVAAGLKFLSTLYLLCRPPCNNSEDVLAEMSKLKCKALLESVFESDKEPLLHAAASRLLQSVFPRKELHKQVKDTLRLHGVVKSISVISSRLGFGGTTGRWIVEEFTAQMGAVSKIALHRRSNLAAFLESNGSEVVDGLMKVVWGIMDFEQLDTQTMNNIVISSVELIYCYAECLALHGKEVGGRSVAPAVSLLRKLLLSPNEAVQTSSSLALSSRLLQVPFPKQTMLATDDVENVASPILPVETAGITTQMMMEEDGTPSVQYCCDGCNTVPIPRRRWHCSICPDFDLCDACHELFGAGRLPLQQHPRDHPMIAIPVAVETLGGDNDDIHLSTADLTDPSLVRMPADSGAESLAKSIHVLETSGSDEYSVSIVDPASISASKRAVNSMLLAELLEQLNGWMRTTPGVHAVPVMQFFYRLASAVGGPLVNNLKTDDLNLERLIRWLLEEMNLKDPFVPQSRSSFGEVAILVFMFFTLMLRNWHQPGSESSASKPSGVSDPQDRSAIQMPITHPSSSSIDDQVKTEFASQLLQACTALRQQPFVNYLMDTLQELMHVFKSSAVALEAVNGNNSGVGCGMLLTIRRELPAGNFSPFFSDSYVKAHRTDLFMDYHRLLLENVFRLVYSLVRPEKQDKGGDKDKIFKSLSMKDLKLDGYQDVLCSYINNPNTTFIRRYARRLFLHLCGSKTQYYSVRDSWQLTNEYKRLQKHVSKSGGFQNPASYERSVKIVKCLSVMAEIAAARPRNWQKYCLNHGNLLPYLLDGIFSFGEESVIQTLKLLNLGFYTGKDLNNSIPKSETGDSGTSSIKSVTQLADSKKKKKGEDGTEASSEKTYMDMESLVHIFTDKDGDILRQFIDCFLLEWNSSSVRTEAKGLLYGIWHHGRQTFKETLLMSLLQKANALPLYGQNIIEYTELISMLLGKGSDSTTRPQGTDLIDRCLTADVIKLMFETLHSQNELLANHPNSRIYNTLSGLVEFDGYYLESEPCVLCSSPEVPYSKMKLESLKSELKFTDNRIIVKCTGSYTIQTVIMNVHDARKSKSVKVLNLYYNNRPVADLSELKNNWALWKRAKSCNLIFNQTELKVDFPIPITACNFMIELDSFYENLQALSLEPLQCPRCSRPVTDKHGICSNCHENAYQCRQCRNINYENLDSFLCNECGYSKYGRFEFNFMAKPSFLFDIMENDDDMKRGLAAIESESENAHRRYQQLLGFKKPLLKILSSIGENEMDSLQKDSVQQMMVSLPGPSCKINRKIALLGVLYGEKCKAAFDSVSKSVQTLQGLRRVLMNYLRHKQHDDSLSFSKFSAPRTTYSCYGCAITFVTQCLEILLMLSKHPVSKKQLVNSGILTELFENNIHRGPKTARTQAREALSAFSEGDLNAVTELNSLILKKVMYCLEHHRSLDIAVAIREEMLLLSEVFLLADEFWESRLRLVFQLLFSAIKVGGKHPAISEHVILPCLRIVSAACTPPKPDGVDKEQGTGKPKSVSLLRDENNSKQSSSPNNLVGDSKLLQGPTDNYGDNSSKNQDMQLLSYSEWEKGATYLDFVRRRYKISQSFKGSGQRSRSQRCDFLTLKYGLRWKRRACKPSRNDMLAFELGSWVTELVLSACSQSMRSEMCMLITLLSAHSSSRRYQLLNLVFTLLPATSSAGESAAEYFEMFFKMMDPEEARLFLTVRGGLATICKLISQEVKHLESLERSLHIDISQGFILHKLIELLGKFLEVANIRRRFMQDDLLSEVLEALIVIRGLIVQKTKLISDCNRLLKDLLDSLLTESTENKRQFIRACIRGLQIHGQEKKGRNTLFILEQLCNLICPSKPESVYLLVLNKAHTQEEFIRGSMNKNPYSSAKIGPLMRDVKNKICNQLDLLGLVEDDYGMELLVAGNIISLDLSIIQVYEQVWKRSSSHSASSTANSTLLSSNQVALSKDGSPMIVTYRLQGLDGEATEPMIKEVEEDREESLDPEVEFAIAGAVREYNGLEIILAMVQRLRDDLKANQEQLIAVLNFLMLCCKIRENRRTLLKLGALGLLLDTARRAFSSDAMELAECILLIVESLTLEANDSDTISITQSGLTVSSEESGAGEQAKKIILMFLERLCHTSGLKKSNKQQRNTEMVARILPYLTYGEPAAMEALIQYFEPFLKNWGEFDKLQKQHEDDPKDESIAQQATKQMFTLENFVRVSESLKTSACGERLKDIILEKGITVTAVEHLRESFIASQDGGFNKSSAEWTMGLKLPSVPLILSILRGLSMGHKSTQTCIDEGGILPLLHALEGVPGENEIGARAENLLDTLSDKEEKGDGFLGEKICCLRHASRDEMRRLALMKRQQLLQGLGMHQELGSDGGDRIVVSRPLEGLEDVEEEENGLACMVCREGYSLRPTDLLGVYSFSKRVNLGAGNSGIARGECVYTTVSHFNIIHFQCHQEAKRADAALKTPKKEWEGATLRNNETLCNSLFPVRGPSVPTTQYIRYVDQYWDHLSALGRADGSRLRLLTYDIVLMLARFATGASFSQDSKGGGRESNSRFLPFMIQMAYHLLDQGGSTQRRTMARSLAAYISHSTPESKLSSSPSGTQPSTTGTEETVQFMMVNSLLSESYESWLQHRRVFLQRGIYHAYMQHVHGRSSTRSSSSPTPKYVLESSTSGINGEGLLPIVQSMLVYTGLIEQLQIFLKVKKPVTAPSNKTEGTSAVQLAATEDDLEPWEVAMRERLVNVGEMVGYSKELLSWLEEMTSVTDLQEAFDVMGVLTDVLSGGFTSCEDFVQAAISAGKS